MRLAFDVVPVSNRLRHVVRPTGFRCFDGSRQPRPDGVFRRAEYLDTERIRPSPAFLRSGPSLPVAHRQARRGHADGRKVVCQKPLSGRHSIADTKFRQAIPVQFSHPISAGSFGHRQF